MNLIDELNQTNVIFIDTAPFIYYIEAHPQYGPLTKEIFISSELNLYSSVITLTEILPKPIESGDKMLARKFAEFLKYGENLNLVEISINIAERAGRLRGKYPYLRTMDAIQVSASIEVGADVFLTNDKKLKKIKEIRVLTLNDYLD